MARVRLTLAAVLALAACAREAAPGAKGGLGRRVAAGEVRALAASSDGAFVAYLDGCREAVRQYLPPRTASCTLRVVPSAGGDAARVADAVTTLPQGFGWAPDAAALAGLAGYDYANGTATLVLWQGGAAREIARGVTFHGFAPGGGGELAAVAEGRLVLASAASSRSILGVERAATFELAPAPAPRERGALAALVRTRADAGGVLLALAAGTDEVARVAGGVTDYGFAPGGRAYAFTAVERDGTALFLGSGRAARRVGGGAQSFAFSRDGAALAWVGDAAPGRQGALRVARSGEEGAVVAREVGEFRWAAAAPRVAWLERYDPRVRSGTIGAGGPGLAPRTFAGNVTDFALSPDGRRLAYLQHTTRGGYSVDLALADLDAPKDAAPTAAAQGVFGFDFSPDGAWLYYRTRCTRNAEACDLERVPAGGLAPGAKPEVVAAGVKSFEFDPRAPGRLLLGFQRAEVDALDVAVWAGGKLTKVDEVVVPGTARFLGPDSRRVVYAVKAARRAGVYVADVP